MQNKILFCKNPNVQSTPHNSTMAKVNTLPYSNTSLDTNTLHWLSMSPENLDHCVILTKIVAHFLFKLGDVDYILNGNLTLKRTYYRARYRFDHSYSQVTKKPWNMKTVGSLSFSKLFRTWTELNVSSNRNWLLIFWNSIFDNNFLFVVTKNQY